MILKCGPLLFHCSDKLHSQLPSLRQKGHSNRSQNPASQHPGIPASQHPGISTTQHPSILASLHASIPASQHPIIPASQPGGGGRGDGGLESPSEGSLVVAYTWSPSTHPPCCRRAWESCLCSRMPGAQPKDDYRRSHYRERRTHRGSALGLTWTYNPLSPSSPGSSPHSHAHCSAHIQSQPQRLPLPAAQLPLFSPDSPALLWQEEPSMLVHWLTGPLSTSYT